MTLKEAQQVQSKLFPKHSLKANSEPWEEYTIGKRFFYSKLGKSFQKVLKKLAIPYTMDQNDYAWNGKELSLSTDGTCPDACPSWNGRQGRKAEKNIGRVLTRQNTSYSKALMPTFGGWNVFETVNAQVHGDCSQRP